MLLHGADVTATNVEGDSAFSLAIRAKARQAQTVLEQHILGQMKNIVNERLKM